MGVTELIGFWRQLECVYVQLGVKRLGVCSQKSWLCTQQAAMANEGMQRGPSCCWGI